MKKLSVVILTYNSEKYLYKVLKSVSWADEVLLIDSGSTDETLNICGEFANTNFITQTWLGFGAQKQFGVNTAKNDWIFVLDSDEIITNELAEEISQILENPEFNAYKVARLNYFFGKPVRSMGLYPDYTIRLFNKKHAKFNERKIHESVVCSEKIGVLKNHFIHYAYENIEQFIAKQNRYSGLNQKQNRFKAVFGPCWTFFNLFILKGGFIDGWRGFIIAKLYSQYTFWKYIK